MSVDDVAFMGPDGLINTAFIDGAGDAAEGAYITFGGLPPASLDTAAGQDWYARISERLGRDPDAYAVYAYEAAVVAIQAIDQVQAKDRQAILDTMICDRRLRRPPGRRGASPRTATTTTRSWAST